jgi:hypothetical protein
MGLELGEGCFCVGDVVVGREIDFFEVFPLLHRPVVTEGDQELQLVKLAIRADDDAAEVRAFARAGVYLERFEGAVGEVGEGIDARGERLKRGV